MALDTIIALENVDVFQNDNLILSDVNLTLKKGEFVYLIGKTGSGKSSLLRIIYGDIPIKNGIGLVAGYNIKKLKRRQIPYLRRKIGIIFQDFQLLPDRTVHDNLLFVLKATGWKKKNVMNERIKEVLGKVDLVYKDYKMPHQLSGGEQQRIVVARALLNNPDIILADEPTGNLDPATSEDIINLLFEISKSGRAVIMATHNYTLLKKYQAKTYRCFDGKLINEAEREEIIDFNNLSGEY
ncbi:MAG: ATP-binding cassette domain-containing protein [Chlorobi bacterium]|nr:ATP-binding cassette domain-containing protein [Chlorobiota bacterium]